MASKTLYLLLLAVPVLCVPLQEPATQREAQEQLILTQYLEAGKIEEAQNLSRVKGDAFPEDIPSYSGFFAVDKSKGSNTFFWFFPAEHDYKNAPVLLWLQGGPGASSLSGLFIELGPFYVGEDSASLFKNPYSWHKNHSLLFIDNPVGAGFSYVTTNDYARDETRIGKDLYSAMVQFFTLFPNLQSNDFFIAGESYAGKYVPALGHTIHQNNLNATLKINLKGILIGDGLIDSNAQFNYRHRFVENNAWKKKETLEEQNRQLTKNKKLYDVMDVWNVTYLLYENSYNLGHHNALTEDEVQGSSIANFIRFLKLESTRAALHVGSAVFDNLNTESNLALGEDMYSSVAPWVEEILNVGYRVVFYNGDVDPVILHKCTENMLLHLKFKGAEAYQKAENKLWGNSTQEFGHIKTGGSLTYVLVKNAGHMVPADQPAVAFDLVYMATRNKF